MKEITDEKAKGFNALRFLLYPCYKNAPPGLRGAAQARQVNYTTNIIGSNKIELRCSNSQYVAARAFFARSSPRYGGRLLRCARNDIQNENC
jgi:hypothetical protein